MKLNRTMLFCIAKGAEVQKSRPGNNYYVVLSSAGEQINAGKESSELSLSMPHPHLFD